MSVSGLYVVVGLGKTGLSCVKHLVRQGFCVAVTDSRAIPPCIHTLKEKFPEIPVYLDNINEDLLAQAKEIVISPGVSIKESSIARHHAKVIGDIELFMRYIKTPVVAITGSNGKSTVTTLVGEMAKSAGLSVHVGGNLGVPALDLLTDSEADLYILELSSFQLEATNSLKLKIAVNLNISPDHLDRYNDFEEYARVKQSIYKQCEKAVINRDDELSHRNVILPDEVISFGISEPHGNEFGLRSTDKKTYLAYGKENLLLADELLIKGRHQLSNALAALALGRLLGLPFKSMLNTLRNFSGLKHRCQWIANIDDVIWYNDSKATNVGATKAALIGLGPHLPGKLVLIAGGLGKGADFLELRDSVRCYVKHVVLLGQDKEILATALAGSVAISYAGDLNQAVKIAKQYAVSGDAVLLSPACASLDMYRDFEHRGETFINLVRKLQHATVKKQKA